MDRLAVAKLALVVMALIFLAGSFWTGEEWPRLTAIGLLAVAFVLRLVGGRRRPPE
ncbi:hypothetical protein [Roseisolibacter agri]|uniref:Uncharacterized protein n=1 Tax=Roseisolibacter agri TaxID=2014610 RepID=A0AA37QBM6_9BACT|nr:hypothetical protein [Roseisolibacter agri]GLC27317.1 hypothetical protein rosag_38300 [Roseisolibacter agri]